MTGSDGVTQILAVTRTVSDFETAAAFYCRGLDFARSASVTELSTGERSLLGAGSARVFSFALTLGCQQITLLRFAPTGAPYPEDGTSSDLWFQHCAIVVSAMADAFERVMAAGALPITEGGPQHLPANTGGVAAYKFRDPFGHPLELLAFPKGVGDPRWHEPESPLFQGIDHTAIAVSDRDASTRFYTEALGLSVGTRTRNRGAAQTRLDAVPEDDVDVVPLEPGASPPHLELLAYKTGTRRPRAHGGAGDAAVSWTVALGNVAAIAARLIERGQPVRHGVWEGRPAIAFEDPDGHAWICRDA